MSAGSLRRGAPRLLSDGDRTQEGEQLTLCNSEATRPGTALDQERKSQWLCLVV
jgi:hypothetical protein